MKATTLPRPSRWQSREVGEERWVSSMKWLRAGLWVMFSIFLNFSLARNSILFPVETPFPSLESSFSLSLHRVFFMLCIVPATEWTFQSWLDIGISYQVKYCARRPGPQNSEGQVTE